ncbi:AMMECR1 domain-containing protein [Chaetomium fimeti]|uniref:AMMECR1 domain-containing protein n=1 Tax=Chaetomium fimeti TaxID=1854472 RepID=A0AAE0H6R9_9PEZI|nr:AMMECR1 domain-containing protein [Chaetomium fimeti]
MASTVHCLFCFEALAAHLEKRKSMTLAEVHKSWAEYSRSVEDDSTGDVPADSSKLSKRLPALRRVTEDSSSSGTSSASNSTLSLGADTPATSTSSIPATGEEEEEEENDGPTPPTESPLFVTWNTVSERGGEHALRGCIGTFEAQELDSGLSSYAVISATQDTRFHAVRAAELPSLAVAVTLLTDFEPAADPADWELGTHGLRISFHHHGRRYGATYLPDVAVEQGWTKEETLVSLMRKAGWVGRKDRWAEIKLDVVRYQGKKVSLEYAEFKRWRDWVDGVEE